MSPTWIEIDDEVMAKIKEEAEPFVDSPNDGLRQLLGLGPASEATCAPLPSRRPPRASGRAPIGKLLPIEEYELPLLRALSQLGGSAQRTQVRDAVEPMLAEKLTDLDHQRLQSGEVRWENRLGFARIEAVRKGSLCSNSRRGIWELTDAGIERLGGLEAELQERERTVPR